VSWWASVIVVSGAKGQWNEIANSFPVLWTLTSCAQPRGQTGTIHFTRKRKLK
jgi:hypothetical protein